MTQVPSSSSEIESFQIPLLAKQLGPRDLPQKSELDNLSENSYTANKVEFDQKKADIRKEAIREYIDNVIREYIDNATKNALKVAPECLMTHL